MANVIAPVEELPDCVMSYSMSLHQIDQMDAYVRFLQKNSQGIELMFKELLIGVTSFFRDAAIWKQLKKKNTSIFSTCTDFR
jgi:chemotaxis methyl-accepting protein methylase